LNKRNCITGLLLLGFFAFFYAYTMRTAEEAAFWPKLICIAGMALSAANAAISGMKWMKEKDAMPILPLTAAQTKRALILTAIAVVWIFLLEILGFLSASMLATIVIVLYFEPIKDKRHIIRDLVAGVVFSIVLYMMFTLLGIHFPKGILI